MRDKVDPQNLETIPERVKGEAVRSEAWKTLEIIIKISEIFLREKYLLYPREESSGVTYPINTNISQALCLGICTHVRAGFQQQPSECDLSSL